MSRLFWERSGGGGGVSGVEGPCACGHNQPRSDLDKISSSFNSLFYVYLTGKVNYSVEGMCNLCLIPGRVHVFCIQIYSLKR